MHLLKYDGMTQMRVSSELGRGWGRLTSDAAVPDDSNIYSRDMDEVKNFVAREEIADSSAPYMAYIA